MAMINMLAVAALLGAALPLAQAQAPWSALPGGCGSTDNNFYSGAPSSAYPVARYKTPGGSIAFNGFHDGFVAVNCNVDNPRFTATGPYQTWNKLQVTYRDPDGLGNPGQQGSEYQAFVQLVRVSKITGVLAVIATFDSNLQCAQGTSCVADNNVRRIDVPFAHAFDFNNYAYAVYVRLHRALATFSLSPAVYQVRLEAAQPVISDTSIQLEDSRLALP
ncbi:MAG: hypothetical protein JWN34_3902 [Bryobacterales bacterium]|nr:hypothetical protein [Bryobacterales bacterium]